LKPLNSPSEAHIDDRSLHIGHLRRSFPLARSYRLRRLPGFVPRTTAKHDKLRRSIRSPSHPIRPATLSAQPLSRRPIGFCARLFSPAERSALHSSRTKKSPGAI